MKKMRIRKLISILVWAWILVLTPVLTLADHIDLPRDTAGWTIFTPSSDSRIVYVSSSGSSSGEIYTPGDAAIGSNPFDPVGPIQAFDTYADAYANTRAGYPDWILIERGGEYFFSIGTSIRSGRAADEPFVVGAYGSSGASPLVKTGAERAFSGRNLQYFAIFGIDFYAHTRDPDGPDYIDGTGNSGFSFVAGEGDAISGLLFEGCKFRFYSNNNFGKWQGTFVGDIDIRRCLFTDNYSESAHSQGLYTSIITNITLEENIFIHNGWYMQQEGTGSEQDGGQATMFNHNTYFTNSTNASFIGNMFLTPSSSGTKWTANDGFVAENILLDNNLFVDGEVAISIGGNTVEPLRFKNPVIRNNVFTNIGRSRPTNRTLGWGIWAQDWDGGLIANNLLMNQPSDQVTNNFGISFTGTSQNVSINGNIIHNMRFAYGLILNDERGSDVVNMRFVDNKIQIDSDARYFIYARYHPVAGWDFSDNLYYGDQAEDRRFAIDGTAMPLSQWQSETGDNSTFAPHTFPDPTRDIEGYQAHLGQEAGIDAFILACRNQDRFDWDPQYTASSVNAWIKEGFDLTDTDDRIVDSDQDGTDADGGSDGGGDSGGGSGCFISSL